MDFSKFKVLSFDCYGTIIDWEKGILDVFKPWISVASKDISSNQVLELFGKFESEVQTLHPDWLYTDILKLVAEKICNELGASEDETLQQQLATSIGRWPAFSDSKLALQRLSKRYRLVILSNITEESFRQTNQNQLQIDFHQVYTAQRIGSYKPDPNNFEFLIKELAAEGIQKNEILHVAQSLFHDISPASQLGLKTAWIDRRKDNPGFGATPKPNTEVKPDVVFGSLEELVVQVERSTEQTLR